jgi:hypothetical protein
MARVAVIGEPPRIHGYGLPGAILCPATDQAEAVLAWRGLPDDIDVAVLTPNAARWLASEIAGRPGVLPVLLADASLAGSSRAESLAGSSLAESSAGSSLAESGAGSSLAESGDLPEPSMLADPEAPGECGLLAEPDLPPAEPDPLAQPRLPPDLGDLPGAIPPQDR